MKIHFSEERWGRIRQTFDEYWNRKTDRLVCGAASIEYPLTTAPDIPPLTQATCHELSIPPEKIADRIMLDLSQFEYYGDAFPFFNMDCFGPGVIAAFLGAQLDNSTGRVWFHPREKKPIHQLHLTYDPENVWLRRIREICVALNDRMEGRAVIGLPDLGSPMDILSSFLPGEELLYALYDEPEEVQRLRVEMEELWWRFYTELLPYCSLPAGGNTNWAGLYSAIPSYILQCDFSYMISPSMFREFVLPSLQLDCRRLGHTIYHMDGIGELPHVDSLLDIEELDAIQWIPGEGSPLPNDSAYIELYRKILGRGKQVQIQTCPPEVLSDIVRQIGGRGLFHSALYCRADEKAETLAFLKRLGVEP